MELDLEFKDKQLMELQELYIYQHQLTEKLSEKLLRTQRQFEESGQSFFDLEDKYRQANDTIKEKEYLIFNLLGSEKPLAERAIDLRAELENAASGLSGLFAKIGLNSSFYGSYHVITFSNINSEFLKHSSSFIDLIREISSEADAMLHDLQSNLNNQEQSITAFAEQQHEVRDTSQSVDGVYAIQSVLVVGIVNLQIVFRIFMVISDYLSLASYDLYVGSANGHHAGE